MLSVSANDKVDDIIAEVEKLQRAQKALRRMKSLHAGLTAYKIGSSPLLDLMNTTQGAIDNCRSEIIAIVNGD